jgi:nucleoside 2-deoxyribosyltransferase
MKRMGRQIQARIAAFVPFGRVHVDENPGALEGRLESCPITLDSDHVISEAMLRLCYCTIANRVDASVASRRVPQSLRTFAAWWREGATYIQHESRTWGSLGIRNRDTLILIAEPPDDDTRALVDMASRQIDSIDARDSTRSLEQTIAQGIKNAMSSHTRVRSEPKTNQVFIAMPMNESAQPGLADVHDGLKAACEELGLEARRVDDVQTNTRITDTIRHLIESSEFVIADLTHNRPNVFFEAGYAEGIGKTPIYLAAAGTELQFDVKDYPVIFYENIRALREGVSSRLKALVGLRSTR